MRPTPKLSEFPRYPVVAGTALLTLGVTIAWWAKVDISPLFETAMIRRGELWRLVTSALPHNGILHLVFNLYWLWIFGTIVEEVFGHFKTAILLLFLAAGSGAWEFALAYGGVGLSGIGYGLFGLLWMLSRYDERFRDAIDGRTIQLFVVWFFLCIFTTVTNILPVGNIAHGAGAVLGILIGLAIAKPDQRALMTSAVATVLLFGLWGATLGRPKINLSGKGGYEEADWGYQALVAKKNDEALRWWRDAVAYQPKNALFLYDLSIAYRRTGRIPEAIAACKKAAEEGDPDAQYNLYSSYESGSDGLPKDAAQALYWLRKLAEQNTAEALNNVAWAYATSSDPSIRNPTSALQYARKAVEMEKDKPVAGHLDTLAEALYVNQKVEDAVKTEEQAVALASDRGKIQFRKSLERYQLALKANDSSKAK